MRRFLLVFTVISFAGWSQPAQPQAQPPIVVKAEMPPTPHRDFIGYLQALGPLIAASVAVGVGLMQRHLQKQQLKQNLFDKRYKVYAATDTFLTNVMNVNGAMDVQATQTFRLETAHAEFLFGDDITDFIGLIFRNSLDLALVTKQIDLHVAAHENFKEGRSNDFDVPLMKLTDLMPQKVELLDRFIKAQAERNRKFRPYLVLNRDLPWYARFERDLNALVERLDEVLMSTKEWPKSPAQNRRAP
jgi:hypothetical protein